MGDLWRSQPMSRVQIMLDAEATHDTIDELGQLGLVQFVDLNPNANAFQRHFIRQVKRTEEMERQLKFFLTQINIFNENAKHDNIEPIVLKDAFDDDFRAKYQLNELEVVLSDYEASLSQSLKYKESLQLNHNKMEEFLYILQNEDELFCRDSYMEDDGVESESSDYDPLGQSIRFGFITGVIHREKFSMFEKILFRSTVGNSYLRHREISKRVINSATGKEIEKNVFIIFFRGEKLKLKITKICESFYASIFQCPESAVERQNLLRTLEIHTEESRKILHITNEDLRIKLNFIASELNGWFLKVRKEKAIYHTMNLFDYDLGRKCLIAEGWIPTKSREEVNFALRRARDRSGSMVPSVLKLLNTSIIPPTYFEVNKFIRAFQSMVDAYGIPRYREINPTVFMIVTFPFMFGLMFGDVGHGLCLLIFAIFMIIREKKWEKEGVGDLLENPFSGRYVMVLMGLFAIYCGLLYNEFFSIPMRVLPSMWVPDVNNNNITYKVKDLNRSYEFGIDWMWKGASNELLYYNSVKMKMSVIVGVIHMSMGIVLKFLNSIYFGERLELLFECIPQLLMLLSLFGYLSVLIFIKWLYPFYKNDVLHFGVNDPSTPHVKDAPQLLTVMIYMFLSPTSLAPAVSSDWIKNNWHVELFRGQVVIQCILLTIAILAVPVMLFAKPLILLYQHKKMQKRNSLGYISLENQSSFEETELSKKIDIPSEHENKEFQFGEIMIHQVIETIEFSLGTISNTASYLRLWALSLAHSELATVFWNMGFIQTGLSATSRNVFLGTIINVVCWTIFCAASVGVLLVLESLSAFLHALRLHWVEFQNKFYKGDGYLFVPFSYREMKLTSDA